MAGGWCLPIRYFQIFFGKGIRTSKGSWPSGRSPGYFEEWSSPHPSSGPPLIGLRYGEIVRQVCWQRSSAARSELRQPTQSFTWAMMRWIANDRLDASAARVSFAGSSLH